MPRKRRPLPPSSEQLRDEAAAAGDPFRLLDEIVATHFTELNASEEFPRLHALIRQAAKTDPLGFSKRMLERGISTVSYLAMRVEFYLRRTLTQRDHYLDRQSSSELLPEVFDELLPKLIEIHKHLAEMGMCQASMERQIELARSKRLENELTELLRPSPRKSSTSRTAPAACDGQPVEHNGPANRHSRNGAERYEPVHDESAQSVENTHGPVNRLVGMLGNGCDG